MKQNELLRLSLALLLTAPEGIDVNYTFAGESDIDGTAVNIVNAEFSGSSYKLFIGKSNNLPVAMSYRGMGAPKVFTSGRAPPCWRSRSRSRDVCKKIDVRKWDRSKILLSSRITEASAAFNFPTMDYDCRRQRP